MPSFTAWNPFNITTGIHPNHRVYMLPWVFASCKWKRCHKKNRWIPIYRSQTAPAIHQPSGEFCAENIIPMHIIVATSSCFAENKAFSSQFYLLNKQGEVIFFLKHILQQLQQKKENFVLYVASPPTPAFCTLLIEQPHSAPPWGSVPPASPAFAKWSKLIKPVPSVCSRRGHGHRN